jgi:hypothetical protein
MAIENAIDVDLAYKVESSYGVLPGASGGQMLRRVSSNLAPQKDSYQSQEVSEHQQVSDMRHGMQQPGGTIAGELSPGTYKDFTEAAVRGTWAAGVAKSQVQFTSVTSDNGAGTYIFAGGDPVAEGLRLGDVIRFGTLATAANNSVNHRVISFGGTSNRTVGVYPPPVTDAVADTSFTVTVVGKKLLVPLTRATIVKRSFLLEQRMTGTDFSELFLGSRIGGARWSLPPTGLVGVEFDAAAQAAQIVEGGSAPYLTAPASVTTTGIAAAVSGNLRVGSTQVGLVTGLNLGIALNPTRQAVVGSNLSPDVFLSRFILSGQLSFVLDGATMLKNFINEDEINLMCLVELAGVVPKSFVSFVMHRIKFTGTDKTIGNEGPVVVNQPFQALLNPATTGQDQSSLIIQDSDA